MLNDIEYIVLDFDNPVDGCTQLATRLRQLRAHKDLEATVVLGIAVIVLGALIVASAQQSN